jgi:ribonuclease Z
MDLIFLGTSSGTPTKTRNVSGVAVRRTNAKSWFLVDCGEGTQHQVLRTPLSLKSLKGIFITHVHGDHCYGLPGLLASATLAGRTEPLHIVGPAEIADFLGAVRNATQLRLTFDLIFTDVAVLDSALVFPELKISKIALSHRVPSYAYVFAEGDVAPRLDTQRLAEEGIKPGPVWGQLQNGCDITLEDGRVLRSADYLVVERAPRTVVICGDNDNPELLRASCADADVIVHEATYTSDVAEKVGAAPQHCAADTIARFAESIRLRNLVLTHFSPRYADDRNAAPSIADIEVEARAQFTGNLFLASDFDVFRLDKDGLLARFAP